MTRPSATKSYTTPTPGLSYRHPAALRRADSPGGVEMKTWWITLLLSATIAVGSGCAKPDWIQQTLVTADVTGVWVGSMGKPPLTTEVRLELQQQGSKVTSNLLPTTTHVWGGGFEFRPGPLEGTVSGDVFSFKVTTGAIAGEMTVNGDEMEGYSTIGGRSYTGLRRVESVRPASQR